LIGVYDSRVTAQGSAMVPPEMAERLEHFLITFPSFGKREIILAGLAKILDVCERSPGQAVPELKLGAFKCRGQTSLGFRVPLDLDQRLTSVLNSLPRVSRRDVLVAGIDLILTKCEAINGGPFRSSQVTAQPQQL
jgi:hypothetical protein